MLSEMLYGGKAFMAKTLGQLAALAAGAEIIGNQDLEIKEL